MGTGKKIKDILKEQGRTIKQLSKATGISVNTLYSITKRDSMSVTYPILEKVAQALGVKVIDLLPEEARESALDAIKHVEENYSKTEHAEEYFIREALYNLPIQTIMEAQEHADGILVNSLSEFNDAFLRKQLLDEFSCLNRRGKIEALFRIEELGEMQRFQKKPDEE